MIRIREVVAYKHYFDDFVEQQPKQVRRKIFRVIEAIETLQHIPSTFIKHLQGTKGLYEARIMLGSNIWRVFCFFDDDKVVILLNGFQKKTERTPKNEIERALRLMTEYLESKRNDNGH
ncbi:type II toxin-antitoxin system RelE/ParE family toxin [Dyadobacter pollutisoli]|jgi:phage-related protein|uniref:Type II toxin-antitoxin system RelE/ParE family toxin n=1 Tax=Dyadobacter pollutisoli TaxID=2910158 RepID=A0A9E8NCJ3_9BACT|nr:type II toxin-antitoxin system RelE/ParE family toxin [Dyadobacter pollutisoli]WAC12808.1 type II toxin-antitoxin system RelE/ParE family toxin [Dyadobacter pollutisoli]